MSKIAILILAHKNFEQIDYLVEQFDKNFYDIYIHIDSKQKYNYYSTNKNVYILEDKYRIDITWGKISMVKAMINLLNMAYYSDNKYSYYWFVSGQDLLIKNSRDIFKNIQDTDVNYINFFDKKFKRKFQYRNGIKIKESNIKRNLIGKIHIKIKAIIYNVFNFNNLDKYYFGSQWSILKNSFVTYIYENKLLDIYVDFFTNKLIPDESFFQTILMESPFKNEVHDTKLFIIWPKKSNHPKTLEIEDLDLIVNSNNFIARKFDINIDKTIIDNIRELTK